MRFLLFILFATSAVAGPIWSPSRSWSVTGPGGSYGIFESAGVTLLDESVAWETQIVCGPFHLTLPCQAPGAIIFLAGLSAIAAWLLIAVSSGIRKHALRRTNAA
jgi:hypothetical protein